MATITQQGQVLEIVYVERERGLMWTEYVPIDRISDRIKKAQEARDRCRVQALKEALEFVSENTCVKRKRDSGES